MGDVIAKKAVFFFNGVEVGPAEFTMFDEKQHVEADKYTEAVKDYVPAGYSCTFTCTMTRYFDWHVGDDGVPMMMKRQAHRKMHALERKR